MSRNKFVMLFFVRRVKKRSEGKKIRKNSCSLESVVYVEIVWKITRKRKLSFVDKRRQEKYGEFCIKIRPQGV